MTQNNISSDNLSHDKQSFQSIQSNTPRFKLESFEGPLDLLLHLIKKDKVDIYNIPIADITKQYMKILTSHNLKELDLDIAGEYLLMAATLAQIKSKMLIPIEKENSEDEDLLPEEDPRTELVKKLLEYQRYKEAAQNLSHMPKLSEDIYKLGYRSQEITLEEDDNKQDIDASEIDIFTLLAFFDKLVSRLPDEEPHEIEEESFTVSQKIIEIVNMLTGKEENRIAFSSLFTKRSRAEIIVTFLSVLELTRLRYIYVYQPEPESEIWLRKNFTDDEIDFDKLYSIEADYENKTNNTNEVKNDITNENSSYNTEEVENDSEATTS